jgi:glucose-6-phosphate dehydrogenase assembly protein OpcA
MKSKLNIEIPRTVDLGAIDRELRNLWREASADTEHAVARARMLNLVIFAHADELESTAEMGAELAVHHPSRTIVVAVDAGAHESTLTAEVAARCHLQFGRRQQICSEQVIIRAGGRSIDDVHGVVIPLLTSDLPTFLWWRISRWPEGHSFKTIADDCNRVILDSSTLITSANDFEKLDALMHDPDRASQSRYSVADLNWARLTSWRGALAGLYDVPPYRTYLNDARVFSLKYSDGRGTQGVSQSPGDIPTPGGALLVAGWLASRLGWGQPKVVKGESNGALTAEFQAKSGQTIELGLSPEAAGSLGQINQLVVDCSSGPRKTNFSITMDKGCIETHIVLEGEPQTQRVVGCNERQDPDLVGEEMDIIGRDSAFEDAVTAGVELAREISKFTVRE